MAYTEVMASKSNNLLKRRGQGTLPVALSPIDRDFQKLLNCANQTLPGVYDTTAALDSWMRRVRGEDSYQRVFDVGLDSGHDVMTAMSLVGIWQGFHESVYIYPSFDGQFVEKEVAALMAASNKMWKDNHVITTTFDTDFVLDMLYQTMLTFDAMWRPNSSEPHPFRVWFATHVYGIWRERSQDELT